MATAMARQEGDLVAVEPAAQERVRGLAEGRGDALPTLVAQPVDIVEPAAADDADHGCYGCLIHLPPPPLERFQFDWNRARPRPRPAGSPAPPRRRGP